jgi:hypothetical protein
LQSSLIATDCSELTIEIGGLPIRLRVDDADFVRLLERRYANYVTSSREARFEFEIDVCSPGSSFGDEDASVRWDSGRWYLDRGDFRAEWNPSSGKGRVQQTANPYSIDSVLRIVHTLLLAGDGGFLMHACSAVRNGRAFLFAGVSGAGKTTMARLAPPDVAVLTDEISYVTREEGDYFAFGTPFAGELGRPGLNMRAPLAGVYLLAKGPENKIEEVNTEEAIRAVLRNILFFAKDPEIVKPVFQSACEFAGTVPIRRLTFTPDARVWELIV